MSSDGPLSVDCRGVRFAYGGGDFALRVDELRVEPGERVAVVGQSGCGKTTLLSLLAGILTPDSGTVRVLGTEVSALPDHSRREFRIRRIGLIFQEFELIEHLRVRENVLLPYLINPVLTLDEAATSNAEDTATALGIGAYLARRPKALSQGERQRVAICRALVTDPELILADEPTGNLDPRTTATILDVILSQAARRGATFLMVTHDHGLLDRFDRVVDLGGEHPA